MKSLAIKLACLIVGVLAIVFVVRTAIQQNRAYYRDAITSLGTPMKWRPDGREAQVLIGGNEYDETRIVLIAHHSTIAPNWNEIDPRTTFSTADSVMGLKSSGNIITSYPADPEKSGLWLDGKKQTLEQGVNVYFISERHAATRVPISPDEEAQCLAELRATDLFAFIDKWVLPRLPPAPPGPTVDEIIRSLKSNDASKSLPADSAVPCDEES